MYEINKRVKEIRLYFNLSQSAFAKKLDIATSSVGNWEICIRPVKPFYINAICNVFNVNKEWLEYGTGEMLKKNNEDNPALTQISKEYNLSSTQVKFMKAFLNLSSEQKDTIIEVMQIMANATSDKEQSKTINNYSKNDNNLSIEEKRELMNSELDAEAEAEKNGKKIQL